MASKKPLAPQSVELTPNQGPADLDAVNAAAAEAAGRDTADFQPSDFDHAQAAAAPAQVPPEFEVTVVSMLTGALFTSRPSPDRADNAPAMTGTIQLDDAALRVPLAAFVKSARETGVLPQPGRAFLTPWLMQVVLAARAFGLTVIDAVSNDFRDLAPFEAECEQGRDMGFDGKTLIHPAQLAIASRVAIDALAICGVSTTLDSDRKSGLKAGSFS